MYYRLWEFWRSDRVRTRGYRFYSSEIFKHLGACPSWGLNSLAKTRGLLPADRRASFVRITSGSPQSRPLDMSSAATLLSKSATRTENQLIVRHQPRVHGDTDNYHVDEWSLDPFKSLQYSNHIDIDGMWIYSKYFGGSRKRSTYVQLDISPIWSLNYTLAITRDNTRIAAQNHTVI